MNHQMIAVGLGPADPGLITVKGLEAIRNADWVICPMAKEEETGTAYAIVKSYIPQQKIKSMYFPMKGKEGEMEAAWAQNANEIKNLILQGQKLVFGVIGDVLLYSTYSYIQQRLSKDHIKTLFVPGIHAYSALCALHQVPLALGDESICILPLQKQDKRLERALDEHDNVIIMKASIDVPFLKTVLKERAVKIYGASHIGQEKQQVFFEISEDSLPYMSTILVKKQNK